MEKIKVSNLTKSPVNINLTGLSGNGKIVPVKPKSFAYLTIDELAYLRNTSTAFERGTLKVENTETLPAEIDIPDSPNALSDADITALLKKPLKQVQIALEDIDSISVVRNILSAAKDQDKSIKVVEAIEARLNELLG